MEGLLARKAAWEVVQAVGKGAFADIALNKIYKIYSLKPLDKAFAMELSYGAIRQRYFLDCWIDYLGKIPANKQPSILRWLLHLGIYQILKMDKIPSAAAINTTVELIKTTKLSKLSPVVNAILRSCLRLKEKGFVLPKSNNAYFELAKNESLPVWLAKELISWRGENGALEIAKAFNTIGSIDLRVNLLRSNLKDLQKEFEAFGIRAKFIPNCPFALEIPAGTGEPSKWPGFKEGQWCIQDRSSQLIAPFLESRPKEKILDACAAPGGKSTHIAELIGNNGEVWAVDQSAKRLKILLTNSERLGATCLQYLVDDSTNLLANYPEWKGSFNRILVDAPCSGLGTLSRHPDARWRINKKKIKELVILQKKLLYSLAPLLAERGRLVYSTCTIHPDENFNQIKNFLKSHSEFILKYENQIWPGGTDNGDGFYVAVLDKK